MQAVEKRPSAAFPLSFVVAAYIQVRLTPQDCLPDRQVKSAAGALHLGIFDQLEKIRFSTGSIVVTKLLFAKRVVNGQRPLKFPSQESSSGYSTSIESFHLARFLF
jgi:hypothetical protein